MHDSTAGALWDLHPVVGDSQPTVSDKLDTLPAPGHAAACRSSLVASPDGACLRAHKPCMFAQMAAALPHVHGVRALEMRVFRDEHSTLPKDNVIDKGSTIVTRSKSAASQARSIDADADRNRSGNAAHVLVQRAHPPSKCSHSCTDDALAGRDQSAGTANALIQSPDGTSKRQPAIVASSSNQRADPANVLLQAASALPQPVALRLHLDTPWRADVLPLCLQPRLRLRHLAFAGEWLAPQRHGWLPDTLQLQDVTSVVWGPGRETSSTGALSAQRWRGLDGSLVELLATLPGLRSLRVATLHGHSIAELAPHLSHLSALTQLDLLQPAQAACGALIHDAETDALASALRHLRALQVLHLPEVEGASQLWDTVWGALAASTALSHVSLRWRPSCQLDADSSWRTPAPCAALQELVVHGRWASARMPAALRRALSHFTNLTHLSLGSVDAALTLACATAIAACVRLQRLTLEDSDFGPHRSQAVNAWTAQATALTALTCLTIRMWDLDLSDWSADSLAAFVSPLASIRSVALFGADLLDGVCAQRRLLQKLSCMPELEHLQIATTFLSEAACSAGLGAAAVKLLRVRGCKVEFLDAC
jgi:hypothetical protein